MFGRSRKFRSVSKPPTGVRVNQAQIRRGGVAVEGVQRHVGEDQVHLGDREVGTRVGRHPAELADVASLGRRLGQRQLLERTEPPGRQPVPFRQIGAPPEQGHRVGRRRQAAEHLERLALDLRPVRPGDGSRGEPPCLVEPVVGECDVCADRVERGAHPG